MTDSRLDAYILECMGKEKLRLQEWRHLSNGRRVRYGAVVRTEIKELWESEESQGKIGKAHIYGVVTNKDDYYENSTISA